MFAILWLKSFSYKRHNFVFHILVHPDTYLHEPKIISWLKFLEFFKNFTENWTERRDRKVRLKSATKKYDRKAKQRSNKEKKDRKVWQKCMTEKCDRKVWQKSVTEKCDRILWQKSVTEKLITLFSLAFLSHFSVKLFCQAFLSSFSVTLISLSSNKKTEHSYLSILILFTALPKKETITKQIRF